MSYTSEFGAYPESRSYLEAAKDACNRHDFVFDDMSQWSAGVAPPAEMCRKRVRDCGVYIGIIGFSYGSPVRDEPDISYTELEFAEARRHGLHVLVFLLDEEGEMRPGLVRGNPQYTARQEVFRQRLADDRLIVAFRNPDHLSNLIGQALLQLAGEPGSTSVTPTRSAPFMARAVPEDVVPRPELTEICQQIRFLANQALNGPLNGGSLTTALVGPGGFGKTILADWACHELRSEFPDGVLRVEFGEEPTEQQLIGWCRDLVLALDEECPAFAGVDVAGGHLRRVLADRRVLLVLDDVWRRSDLEPFLERGSSTVRMVTTRDRGILPEGTRPVRVDQLSFSLTQQVLEWGLPAEGLDWSELARRTGGWPLLASLVNGVLRDEVDAGRDVREAVAELTKELAVGGPAVLEPFDPEERRTAIRATVELSITRLRRGHGDAAAERYQCLAIFPEGVDVPLEILATWWGLRSAEVRELARTLLRLSLIESYDAGVATVRLHDILRVYLGFRLTRQEWRHHHAALLDRHRPSSGRWADLADDDDYMWHWAAFHLHESGRTEELASTLDDVAYLATKVHLVAASAVLDDLAFAADTRADERRSWFRRWSHLLNGLPGPADIAATLMARPGIETLIDGFDGRRMQDAHLRYAPGWACPETAETALDVVLGTHQRRVQGCVWSPDGHRLASVDGDGFVRVWNLDGRTEPVQIGGEEWIVALAWSPDGRWLACGDDDGVVNAWRVDGGAQRVELGRHEVGVRVIAFSPDGGRMASGGDDGVRVWTAEGGVELASLSRQGWVRALAWSRAGDHLACAYDDGVVLTWAPGLAESPVEMGRHEGGAFAVCWSGSGQHVTSGGRDGVVRFWPVNRDEPQVELDGGGSSVRALAWSADGEQLVGGSSDGVVRTWGDKGMARPVDVGRHEGGVLAAAWQPDGRALASAGQDGAVRLWRVDPRSIGLDVDRAEDPVLSVDWSSDGRRLASGTRNGSVCVWPANGCAEPELLSRHDHAVQAVSWSPDGRQLASGGIDGQLRVCVADGGAEIVDLLTGNSLRSMAWSPEQSRLACVDGDGSVQIWLLDHERATVAGRRGEWVRALAWSPDGRRFATGDDNGRIQIWDVANEGESVELGRRAEHGVRSIAWSPASRRLATGHNDGTVWLWGPGLDDEPLQLGRHRDEVLDVAWSPDGLHVASIGGDSRLQVRRAAIDNHRPSALSCSLAFDGSLNSLAWHPKGNQLAVAGSHGLYVLQVVD